MQTKGQPYAFTGRFNIFRGRIVSDILLSSTDKGNPNATRIRALWDTGCSDSIISRRVADFLRLESCGYRRYRSPFGGSVPCDVAEVKVCIVLGGVRIPIKAGIDENPNSDCDCDMTLGLDFISMGDFAISHDGEAIYLSFCYPPAGAPTDYTFIAPKLQNVPVVTEYTEIDESSAVESQRRKLAMMDYWAELAKKK